MPGSECFPGQMMEWQMPRFTLKFERDDHSAPRTIEFEGEDPHEAFTILQREQADRQAALWQDGKLLGKITRKQADSWTIG